jgi:hypothetical protein
LSAALRAKVARPLLPEYAMITFRILAMSAAAAMFVAVGACTPTVKVATDEPITINLNVNIKHEILVKVDKQLDSVFSDQSGIF